MTKEAQGMVGHTPTPWFISRDPREDMEWNNHIASVLKPHLEICSMFHSPDDENAEGEANAALIVEAVNSYATLTAENARLREALGDLVGAKALAGVRLLVAGWNGEGRKEGPFKERHPSKLGAHIDTNCGAIYELDDALTQARAALSPKQEDKS